MGMWIGIAVAVVAVLFVIGLYNRLVGLKKQCDNAWAQIDVQLKRRSDLIPNLVETVKGYAGHESSVLQAVTEARAGAAAVQKGDTAGRIAAENRLDGALKGLMVQIEAYPQLKANENFLRLQEELSSTENRISFARQHYNDTATGYNTAIALFPANVVAGFFRFADVTLWQIEDPADRKAPEVRF